MNFTGTRRFVTRMALFTALVIGLAATLYPVLEAGFMHNPGLNAVIIAAILFGTVFMFRQVLRLNPEIAWLESYRRGNVAVSSDGPRLLAPMAVMLGDRKGRLTLSTSSTRSLLDSIGSRLDEDRDLGRYLIGLLILLGLLGTFWGLIQTVGSVGDVVARLSMTAGDPVAAFDDLKRGLATPLSGMGTAFSSSLFGLAGSLMLGFLDLQAGQAQNRFYNELEEWLSSQTRLSSGAVGGEGEQSVPAFIQALLEQTADSLENLQRIMARGEESRIAANSNVVALTEKLGQLSDQMRAEQALMAKIADKLGHDSGGIDEASRMHLRNLDLNSARLIEELTQGRAQMVQDLRSEIRLLARTIAVLAEEPER